MQVRVSFLGRGQESNGSGAAALQLPNGATLADALDALRQPAEGRSAPAATALVVINGRHFGAVARHEDVALSDGDELLFISPVAGG